MELSFENINVILDKKPILKNVSVTAKDRKITGIVGPNGSGKSTLIKTLFGIVKYQSGNISIDGKSVKSYPKTFIAQNIGYISQETSCPFDFTVKEMVAMGLYPHARKYRGRNKEEIAADAKGATADMPGHANRNKEKIIADALEQTGISHLGDRSFLSLSGGEKKSVMLTRTIAQQAETLILDEPTNHLDIRHQLFIMEFLRRKQFTSLIVLHDLNLACMYCDELFLLDQGTVAASGTPTEVLTAETVKKVFGVDGYAEKHLQGECRFFLEREEIQRERGYNEKDCNSYLSEFGRK